MCVLVWMFLHPSVVLIGAENDSLRISAEKFVHPMLICLFVVCSIVFTCLCIYAGEPLRRKYIKKLRDVYLYQNEHLQTCYTEFQNPAWAQIVGHGWALSFVMLTFVIVWTGGGTPFIALVIQVAVLSFAAVFLELMHLLLLGFFIEVTDQYLIVRMGTFRIQVLRLELQSIQSVETVAFRPIRDFGGWGMRMTNNGWAYFLSGTEGVQVTTNTGKKYMIGSDVPDRLEKVIQNKINAINSHD